jgi:hypothetical protein
MPVPGGAHAISTLSKWIETGFIAGRSLAMALGMDGQQ